MPEHEACILYKTVFVGNYQFRYGMIDRIIICLTQHVYSKTKKPKLFTKKIDKSISRNQRGRKYFIPIIKPTIKNNRIN